MSYDGTCLGIPSSVHSCQCHIACYRQDNFKTIFSAPAFCYLFVSAELLGLSAMRFAAMVVAALLAAGPAVAETWIQTEQFSADDTAHRTEIACQWATLAARNRAHDFGNEIARHNNVSMFDVRTVIEDERCQCASHTTSAGYQRYTCRGSVTASFYSR